jgi:hypothetical protein
MKKTDINNKTNLNNEKSKFVKKLGTVLPIKDEVSIFDLKSVKAGERVKFVSTKIKAFVLNPDLWIVIGLIIIIILGKIKW